MSNILQGKALEEFFQFKVQNIECLELTKAYIHGVLVDFSRHTVDFSDQSLTLLYAEAKSELDFEKFKNVGDWLLFTKTFFPESLHNASSEYYDALAQNSYYKCYLILQKQWTLYEELADKFNYLVAHIRGEVV